MQGEKKELWTRLCEQASTEQDPEKLVALAQDVHLLDVSLGSLDSITPQKREHT